uniref:Protein PLASTID TRANSCRIPTIONALLY ACTIVE 10-like n=1 Tax=Nicotiana tabacum TaxID=4097 RepID=A0A1S3X5X0_TOBAC|nr:PREDICTED: protein PLASTID TRANSCRIPTIONALLY ACTIVE 10-like [Nicotiana tabacum]
MLSCRRALGLPLEEPGRYVDPSAFGKDQYDPDSPLYRYDYWGEPKNSEKSKQERMTDVHNKSIVGKGTVWYEMAYEDAVKVRMQMEAQGIVRELYDEDSDSDEVGTDDDDDDEEDFDYSILGDPSANVSNQPYVNGTESRLSDEGMFED